MYNKRFFKYAEHMSELSDYKSTHVGCVIVYKNRVISVGFNQNKTHPIQKAYNKERFDSESQHKLHAEIHALSQIIDYDLIWGKVELYVFRKLKNGSLAMARPCKSCMTLIKELKIKTIHYTTPDGCVTEHLVY